MSRNKSKAEIVKARADRAAAGPIVITTEEAESDERIPVFSIDGVEYTMPAIIPASMALRVIDMIRRVGHEGAVSYLLEEALGEDAYQALLDCPSLKPAQLKAVSQVVQDHVLGALEETSGN